MKAKLIASRTVIALKVAAISLIAVLALNLSWPTVLRRQDAQEFKVLITVGAVAAALATVLVSRRNVVRVLINTPILLVTILLGIVVALRVAGGILEAALRLWQLVLIGGSCGALIGHILLAIGWASAKWLEWQRVGVRGPPTEMSIPAWRWESNGSDAG